jgi:hypothetical protein
MAGRCLSRLPDTGAAADFFAAICAGLPAAGFLATFTAAGLRTAALARGFLATGFLATGFLATGFFAVVRALAVDVRFCFAIMYFPCAHRTAIDAARKLTVVQRCSNSSKLLRDERLQPEDAKSQ